MEYHGMGIPRVSQNQVFPDVALRLSFNLGRQPSQEKGAQAPVFREDWHVGTFICEKCETHRQKQEDSTIGVCQNMDIY